MLAKKVKKNEGLRRTHVKNRPAITPNKAAPTKKRSNGIKSIGTPVAGGSKAAIEVAGSQTYGEYGKPTCLADII